MLLTVYYARLSVRPHTLAAATPSVNVPSSWQVTDQNKAELVQVRHNRIFLLHEQICFSMLILPLPDYFTCNLVNVLLSADVDK